jgi:hypothetical protein
MGILHTDISIVEYPLDLAAEPRNLLARIEALADQARSDAGL